MRESTKLSRRERLDCRSPCLLRFCQARNVSSVLKEHPWYRPRTYLHFDCRLGYRTAQRLATSPKRVAKHAFYPLIGYEIQTQKCRRDPVTGTVSRVAPKLRPIAYAAHLDSHIYSYYAWQMGKLYEDLIDRNGVGDSVLAFRALGKSNVDFAFAAFEGIRRQGDCTALALDVEGFFDNLDHGLLKQAWANLIGEDTLPADHYAVFRSLTRFSRVNRDELYRTLGISIHNPRKGRYRVCGPKDFRDKVRASGLIQTNQHDKGIPQGSPISALLSNLYMLGFDIVLHKEIEEMGGEYFRYCDDILLVVPTDQSDRTFELVVTQLGNLKLNVNCHKIERRCFRLDNGLQYCDKPLQYLGFTFDGRRILLRSAALARYSERMKRGVRLAKATMRKRNEARKSRNATTKPLFKRKLYTRYSHLGRRNFLRYGYRASALMGSRAIRKQLKPLWSRLHNEIDR